MKYVAALALFLVATSAFAQPADQVTLPSVAQSADESSEVRLTNMTGNTLQLTLTFRAAGSTTARVTTCINCISLGAHKSKEIGDFLLTEFGVTGRGMVIVEAYREGQPHTRVGCENDAQSSITVESIIKGNGYRRTMNGIPWFNYVSNDGAAAGLGKVQIVGIKEGNGFATSFGLANHSAAPNVRALVTLRDGIGTSYGTATIDLGPLQNDTWQVGKLFQGLAVSRLNRRGAPPSSLWLEITTADAIAPDATPCAPHPGVFAWAERTDIGVNVKAKVSVTLDASYEESDRSRSHDPPPHCLHFPGTCGGLAPGGDVHAQSLAVSGPALKVAATQAMVDYHDKLMLYHSRLKYGAPEMQDGLAWSIAAKMVGGEMAPITQADAENEWRIQHPRTLQELVDARRAQSMLRSAK